MVLRKFSILFIIIILFIFNVFVRVPERVVNYNAFLQSPWLYTRFLKIRRLVFTYSIFIIHIIRIIFYFLYPRGWANVSFFLQICKISPNCTHATLKFAPLICAHATDFGFLQLCLRITATRMSKGLRLQNSNTRRPNAKIPACRIKKGTAGSKATLWRESYLGTASSTSLWDQYTLCMFRKK